MGLHGRTHEVGDGDAGDVDGVLEGQEDPRPGALVGLQVQEALAVELHLAGGGLVPGVARQYLGQRALSGAVGAHDGVDLTLAQGQVDPLEDRQILLGHLGVETGDLQNGSVAHRVLYDG